MNKAIKKRWLKALRSDAYRQGTDALRFGNTYCCLGVLCDLHAKVMFTQWEYDEATGLFRYFSETIVLPRPVCEWAGLVEQNPRALKAGLTAHNDVRGRSFKHIARLIDTHL
jgi:hypothetical protein